MRTLHPRKRNKTSGEALSSWDMSLAALQIARDVLALKRASVVAAALRHLQQDLSNLNDGGMQCRHDFLGMIHGMSKICTRKFLDACRKMQKKVIHGICSCIHGICMESAVLICYAMAVCRSSPRTVSNHTKMATSWRENDFVTSTEKHLFRFGSGSQTSSCWVVPFFMSASEILQSTCCCCKIHRLPSKIRVVLFYCHLKTYCGPNSETIQSLE